MVAKAGRIVISIAGLLCATVGLGLAIFGEAIVLSRIFGLLGVVLASLNIFVLSPAAEKRLRTYTRKEREFMESHISSPAMKYHMFMLSFAAYGVEIWGAEIDDSKFEVTLSTKLGKDVAKETFICDFEERDPNGILTLDIQHGIVMRV